MTAWCLEAQSLIARRSSKSSAGTMAAPPKTGLSSGQVIGLSRSARIAPTGVDLVSEAANALASPVVSRNLRLLNVAVWAIVTLAGASLLTLLILTVQMYRLTENLTEAYNVVSSRVNADSVDTALNEAFGSVSNVYSSTANVQDATVASDRPLDGERRAGGQHYCTASAADERPCHGPCRPPDHDSGARRRRRRAVRRTRVRVQTGV